MSFCRSLEQYTAVGRKWTVSSDTIPTTNVNFLWHLYISHTKLNFSDSSTVGVIMVHQTINVCKTQNQQRYII